ncbi:MAG TPA: DUF4349 domain-containing protein [Phycisphaerales bacterium]|nr:DUF4349 domain-containing protein [Phycisphaerales bacterium]
MTDTQPTAPISPDIESELRSMTTWTGEKPELWKAALDSAASTAAPRRQRILRIALTTASIAAILLLAVGILTPSLGKARPSSRSVGSINLDYGVTAPPATPMSASPDFAKRIVSISEANETASALFRKEQNPTDARRDDSHPTADTLVRLVIRKATIELLVPDTREAFARCQHLLRADLSEFVEGSSLTGQDKDARAQLTLRVAASRLDEVLNTLRTLGKVDSENATGDDVTAQAVDLDASLRNERAVETEILHLLESRKDAQLKDILELREKLATVRQGIERLQGRRDTLSRQVALASILILIRADDAPKPEPTPAGIFDSFNHEVSAAWTSGLSALTQTIAFLIRIAVGGLIWWLLLALAIAITRRLIRRLIPDPAAIPASV